MIDDCPESLTLTLRFLGEPALWCWEIVETASSDLVDSSWSSEWMGYGSPYQAQAAGLRRLAELAAVRQPRVA
jgi:hypothetical protein